MAAVSGAACSRNPKPQPPAPAPVTAPPPPTSPATPPPPPPAPAPSPAGAADRGRDLQEQDARATERGKAAGRRLLRPTTRRISPPRHARLLQKNVEWMKKWTTTKVMVEGHADSRGTNEYNLALGERRADAVRDYLVSLGVADRSHHNCQQGRGAAVLLGRDRGVLAAEPPRTLYHHSQVASLNC